MTCSKCGKEISEEQVYTYKDKKMCENCLIHEDLFPLGHIGQNKRNFSLKIENRINRAVIYSFMVWEE